MLLNLKYVFIGKKRHVLKEHVLRFVSVCRQYMLIFNQKLSEMALAKRYMKNKSFL